MVRRELYAKCGRSALPVPSCLGRTHISHGQQRRRRRRRTTLRELFTRASVCTCGDGLGSSTLEMRTVGKNVKKVSKTPPYQAKRQYFNRFLGFRFSEIQLKFKLDSPFFQLTLKRVFCQKSSLFTFLSRKYTHFLVVVPLTLLSLFFLCVGL